MRIAAFLAAALAAGAAAAQDNEEYLSYLSELETPGEQWVVISYHYTHGLDCTQYGCVIIGPTENKDACQEWARLYNGGDPDDHSRCVRADGYELRDY